MKNEPNIRIKGFEGEWKECTFNNLVDRISSYSSSKSLPTVEFEDIISGENRLNKDVYSKPIHKGGIAFEKNDVLFGKLRPYLKNILFATFNGIAVGDFWVLRANESYPAFVYTLVNNKSFMDVANISSGSKIPRADWNLVSKHKFLVPSFFEQRAIATYFRHLDSLIEIADKKVASLKQVKEASLQSMFPKEGQKVPEVRFKGFEGEWKTVQLCDCLEVSKERNLDNKYGIEDVLSVSDDSGVTNQIELLGRSFAGKSVSNYGILHEGEIVYTKSPLKSKPFGIIKRNNYKTGIVSVLYAIYKPHIDISSAYIHYYFSPSWRLNNYIHPLVNKGAKNTMNISDETALMGYIPLPPTLSEQRKIASFFVHLDKQIAIAQQRLDLLRRIKSACLDEMFV